MIQNKLKELLNELKKFKVQTILVLDCKKRNDWKIVYLRAIVIASDSDIAEASKSMHQSFMKKNSKNYACKDWIALDVIIKHSIKIFKVSIRRINSTKKWR